MIRTLGVTFSALFASIACIGMFFGLKVSRAQHEIESITVEPWQIRINMRTVGEGEINDSNQ